MNLKIFNNQIVRDIYKTVLYYTQTQKTIIYPNGYEIDGVPQPLGELATGIWHLEYIRNERPECEDTEYSTYEFIPDYDTNQYVQVWTIHQKDEKQLLNWKYDQFSIRIKAPIDLIMEDIGIKMFGWFQINNMPVVKVNDFQVHLYCNYILPEHQTIIDGLGGVIIIEEIPIPLRPTKPYPSWEWVNGVWTAPLPYPEEGEWVWDEDTLSWVTPPEPEPIIEDII